MHEAATDMRRCLSVGHTYPYRLPEVVWEMGREIATATTTHHLWLTIRSLITEQEYYFVGTALGTFAGP